MVRPTARAWGRPSRFSIRSSPPRSTDSLRGRFNPLDTLDPKAEETIDEAGRIADAIVVVHEGGTNDPFWDESARAMVKGLLLHVLTSPQYEGRRNLVTLRKLITRGDWESVEALQAKRARKTFRRRTGCCGRGCRTTRLSTG